MGVALTRSSRWPNIAKKILKILIDHKLLDSEIILSKYPTLIFDYSTLLIAT